MQGKRLHKLLSLFLSLAMVAGMITIPAHARQGEITESHNFTTDGNTDADKFFTFTNGEYGEDGSLSAEVGGSTQTLTKYFKLYSSNDTISFTVPSDGYLIVAAEKKSGQSSNFKLKLKSGNGKFNPKSSDGSNQAYEVKAAVSTIKLLKGTDGTFVIQRNSDSNAGNIYYIAFAPELVDLSSISVTESDQESLSISANDRVEVGITVSPENHTETITATSNDTDVCTAKYEDGKAVIEGVGAGSTTVVVKGDDDDPKATISVTVQADTRQDPDTVEISGDGVSSSKLGMTAGKADVQLTATLKASGSTDNVKPGVDWSSGSDDVATVSDTGLVHAVGRGSTTITATAKNGTDVKASITVTVSTLNPIVHIFDADSAPDATVFGDADVTYTTGTGAEGETVQYSESLGSGYNYTFRGAQLTKAASLSKSLKSNALQGYYITFKAPEVAGKLTFYLAADSSNNPTYINEFNKSGKANITDGVATFATEADTTYIFYKGDANSRVSVLVWTPAGYPAHEHSAGTMGSDYTTVKAATCKDDGLKAKLCTEPTCPVSDDVQTIGATGIHVAKDVPDGFCRVCGTAMLDYFIDNTVNSATFDAIDQADVAGASAEAEEAKVKAAFKTAVEAKVEAALGSYSGTVTAELSKVSYNAAVAGDDSSPSGTNGEYKATVVLKEGETSTSKSSSEITLVITATPADAEVNKDALIAAIAAANTAADAIIVDTDAANVEVGNKWILAADKQTYVDAIAVAQGVVDNDEATQVDVNGAVTTLATATTAFETAQQDGTLPFVPDVDEGDKNNGIFVLDMNGVAAGDYAKKQTPAGTDNRFSINGGSGDNKGTVLRSGLRKNAYATYTKGDTVDGAEYTEDTYAAYGRLDFGGSSNEGPDKRTISYEIKGPKATVKIWYGVGGNAGSSTGRKVALLDKTGKAALDAKYTGPSDLPDGSTTHYIVFEDVPKGNILIGALTNTIIFYKIEVDEVAGFDFSADVAKVKEAMPASKAFAQANVTTAAQAKTAVEGVLDSIKSTLTAGLTWEVTVEDTSANFTAATPGSKETPNGHNGSFGYKIVLKNGDESSEDITGTAAITATAYSEQPDVSKQIQDTDIPKIEKALESMLNAAQTGYEITQATANSDEAIKKLIEDKIKDVQLAVADTKAVVVGTAAAAQGVSKPAVAGTTENKTGTDGQFTFKITLSKGEDKATFSETLKVLATAYSGDTPVKPTVTKVALDQSTASMEVGETLTLTATVTMSDGSTYTGDVTWGSSKTEVATVAAGKVTAAGSGTTDITASVGELSAKCEVTVTEPVKSITIQNAAPTLVLNSGNAADATQTLAVTVIPATATVTWTSSDSDKVSVDDKGKITAVAAGEAEITASIDGASDKVKVTVIDAGALVVEDPKYTVTIDTVTGGSVSATYVSGGESVAVPAEGVKKGTKITLSVSATGQNEIKTVMYSYAEDGKTVERTVSNDGGYTFVMPAANVTVTAVFGEPLKPSTGSKEYKFDGATDIPSSIGDNGSIPEGTTYADGYIKVVGSKNIRAKSNGAILTSKKMSGGLEFTITGTAEVSVWASSTSSKNDSNYALAKVNDDDSFTNMPSDKGETKVSKDTKPDSPITYTGAKALPAGTYRIDSPTTDDLNRGIWLWALTIKETGGVVCEHTNTKQMNAYAATCCADGHTADKVCLDCGKTIVPGEVIPRTGHDFDTSTHKCKVCDIKEPAKLEIVFENDKNNEAVFGYVIDYNSIGGSDDNTYSYNGETVKNCVKFDSLGRLTFKAPAAGKLKLYMTVEAASGDKTAQNVKIDGTDVDITSAPIEMNTTAGQKIVMAKGGTNTTGNTSRLFAIVWENADKTITDEPDKPVYVGVTGVELDKTSETVELEGTLQLTATLKPANPTIKTVSWTSSNERVATVDSTGKVTALREGSAVITVTTSVGGHSASCTVTVTAKKPAAGDKKPLTAAIEAANKAANDIKVDTAAGNVAKGTKWILKADLDAYKEAIAKAQKVADTEGATEAEISAAVAALKTATEAFEKAQKDGTYESGGGGGGGGSMVPTGPVSGGSSSKPTTTTSGAVTTVNKGEGTVTTKTANDGTVTETTKYKDGSTAVVTTKPDGSVTTVINDVSGVKTEAATTTAGATTATITLPSKVTKAVVTVPAKAVKAGTVAVIVKADGTEQVLKTSVPTAEGLQLLVSESVSVKLVDNAKTFSDIAEGYWAKDAVDFASSREIFKGTSDTTFSPAETVDRGMMATVLFRLQGAAAASGNTFFDVPNGTWYADAVNWANQSGVVTGYADGTFGPTDDVTREQMATMLYRYAKVIGMDTSAKGEMDKFGDVADVSSWATEAMIWAVGVGLINGTTTTGEVINLSPAQTASRAEVATLMQRMVSLMMK